MKTEVYYGNLNECIYAGMAGNMFGVPHYKVVEEGIFFVKVDETRYIRLDDIIKGVKKPIFLKRYATKVGEQYVGSIMSLRDIIAKLKNKEEENRVIESDNNKIIDIDKTKTLI